MRHKRQLCLLLNTLLLTISAQNLLSMNNFPGKCDNPSLTNEIYNIVVKAIKHNTSSYITDFEHLKTKITDLVVLMDSFSSKLQRFERDMEEIRRAQSGMKNENGRNKDCASILKWNALTKGFDNVYTIYPDFEIPKKVFCDMTTDGGGWTVIQKRQDGTTDFNQTWNAYKIGFGNPENEYWIGNDVIHELTKARDQVLRVDVEDFNDRKGFATYSTFFIQDESQRYKLQIGGYSGIIGDSMWNVTDWRTALNGKDFATADNDTNAYQNSCTKSIGGGGGWWYNNCTFANLNAPYHLQPINKISGNMFWYTFNKYNTLKKVKMMIRKKK